LGDVQILWKEFLCLVSGGIIL